MHKREGSLLLYLSHGAQQVVGGLNHLATERARRVYLGADGGGGHDDGRRDADGRGGPGERLRMIPGGDRDDSTRALVRRERFDRVEHSARLERAGVLKQL